MSLAVILLALVVLVVGLGLMVLGQASDARGKAQKAADAAAIAAADSIKSSSIVSFARSQQPPTESEDDGFYTLRLDSLLNWSGGVVAAQSFAQANSSSSITDYHSGGGPNPGTHQVTVETLSEETEEVGTGDVLVGTPRGNATATAEIGLKDISCIREGTWDDDDELEDWSIRCNGADFGTALLEYADDTAGSPLNALDSFGDLFEIRLVE